MVYGEAGERASDGAPVDTGIDRTLNHPGRPGEPIDEETLQARVAQMIEDARTFDINEMQADRIRATEYYAGKKFGNEEEGRSSVVMTTLRDTVHSMLPALLKLFFGPEQHVEYKPQRKEQIGLAAQQTEYANLVFGQDNPGYLITNAVLEDALVRRLGIIQYGWEDWERREVEQYTGLSEEQFLLLSMEEGVVLSEVVQEENGDEENTYRCTATRTDRDGRLVIEAIPREEFFYNRNARTRDGALIVGRAMEKSVSDLLEMGYTQDEIDEARGHEGLVNQLDAQARSLISTVATDNAEIEEHAPVLYVECYPRIAMAEGQPAELRKICTLGTGYKITRNVPCNERPFALFTPYPKAHCLEGSSAADLVMDLQLIESSVTRGVLDSLSLSLNQATEIVEGQVNMQDFLNPELGRGIRVRQPGMMREIGHRFVGGDVLPLMDYLTVVKENRTGRTKAGDGLAPDTLQSTSKDAVAATVGAGRDRLEWVARNLSETGWKDLFLGIYNTLKRHQNKKRVIKLRGEWVEVDPRSWETNVEVICNVALGNGLTEQKLDVLKLLKETQEQYLLNLGEENPLVSIAQLRNTLARITVLLGEKDASQFWKEIDPSALPTPPAQPPEDPAVMLAKGQLEIDTAKAQASAEYDKAKLTLDAQIAQAKMQAEQQQWQAEIQLKERELNLREQEMDLSHQREMEKITMDGALRRHELELKYNAEVNAADLQREIDIEKAEIAADAQVDAAKHKAATPLPVE